MGNSPAHLIFEFLSYTLGFRYYLFLRKKQTDSYSDDDRLKIFIGAALGAFLGSHILGVLENPPLLNQISFVYFMGNKTIVGGFLGGLIGVELSKKILKRTESSGDLMVYPIILAMILGRIGCFLAGMKDGTFGVPTHLPWGMNLGDGIPRHPTNLYEILFWIILWIFLKKIQSEFALKDGSLFKICLFLYLVFRFFIEFIKPDYFFSFGLSTIQIACISGILYYYKVFIKPQSLIKNA